MAPLPAAAANHAAMPARLPTALAPIAALTAMLLAAPCQALQLAESLQSRPAEAVPAVEAGAAVGSAVVDEPAPATSEPIAPVADIDRNTITEFVRANLGAPYRRGATGGREGFDCSGLVLRAYAAAGLAVPRVSAEQFARGTAVPLQALKAGDLLFYRMKASEPRQLHVAVYVGEGRAIHASVTHKTVREIDITRPLWSQRLVAARSLL